VDISDFFTPGILYRKPAVDCTRQEVAREVWAQLKQALNTPGDAELSDDMLIAWSLDPAVAFRAGRQAVSTEPLLINTAGSLADRPSAATSIANLFLAADYVRCDINLATMEGANEAGRQAANAILERSGSRASKATLGTAVGAARVRLGQAARRQRLRRRPTQPARSRSWCRSRLRGVDDERKRRLLPRRILDP